MNEKFIPVVFREEDVAHIPIELQRYPHYVVSGNGYEDLSMVSGKRWRMGTPPLPR